MFAKATLQVSFAQRVVATLVASALVLLSIGYQNFAQAANLTNVSDTLSNSDLSVTSSHTIEFTVPAGSSIVDGNNIVITFDSQDDGPGGQDFAGIAATVIGNLTVNVTGGGDAADLAFGGATADTITISGVDASAGDVVEIVVADGVITNPGTTGSYEIEVAVSNGSSDIGRTRVAIIDNVDVSAVVDTTFSFTITGMATSTAVNGETTTGSTSPTVIDFGELTAGAAEVLSQRLNVATNANNGFVVTVNTDGDLASANGAIIDNFDEGSDVADTGTAWNSPVPTINDETSWGHWGMTTSDSDVQSNNPGSAYSGDFGANDFIAASTTPREVFHHDGPADGLTADIGSTTVGYKIEITALQEAADDYNTTLTYIATPTF